MPTNPDENKIQLKEIVNSTPVKKRVRMEDKENVYIVESDDCESLDFIKDNVVFSYKNGGKIFESDVDSDGSEYFTDKDILSKKE